MRNIKLKSIRGFTLVELLVSVGIFVFMTALLVTKYSSFNQGVLLTNLAYDIALTVRTAQSYSINVKSAPESQTGAPYSNTFTYHYGVHFDSTATGNPVPDTQFIFFADKPPIPGGGNAWDKYDTSPALAPDQIINTYNIKRGSKIYKICVISTCDGGAAGTQVTSLDVIYKRPDPDAIITANGVAGTRYGYAEVAVQSSNGTKKLIIFRSTGQIEIKDPLTNN